MTLRELIDKLESLTNIPDSATIFISVDGSTVEAEYIDKNKDGSITIW